MNYKPYAWVIVVLLNTRRNHAGTVLTDNKQVLTEAQQPI